jgi:hypothetical protein
MNALLGYEAFNLDGERKHYKNASDPLLLIIRNKREQLNSLILKSGVRLSRVHLLSLHFRTEQQSCVSHFLPSRF